RPHPACAAPATLRARRRLVLNPLHHAGARARALGAALRRARRPRRDRAVRAGRAALRRRQGAQALPPRRRQASQRRLRRAGPARRDRRLRARGDGGSGRVCVVTGASSGIGRATAQALARLGATLVLVCRDRGRGEETLAALRAESSAAAVALFLADLSSRAEIRRLAAELGERYPAIHVLVNNAGVINLRRSTTVDGIETVFAVNHLAYFLLTHLLVARLRAS